MCTIMNGTIPKFHEGRELPPGYYAVPNPYVKPPSCGVDLLELSRYARKNDKKLVDLTREELNMFSIKKKDVAIG